MTPEQEAASKPTHLGDGVYAEFDGYHLVLRANSHDSPHKVAIEPAVFSMLLSMASRVNRAFDTQHFPGV